MDVLTRERLLFISLGAASLTLAACGLFGNKDEKEGISPAPSGAVSTAPTDTAATTPPTPSTPAGAAGAGNTTTTTGAGTKTNTVVVPDAGVPTDAGKGDAAAPSDAGATSTSTKLKACADKCQGVMQSCLTPTFNDAGIPSIKDPAACQAAAEACRKACAP